MNAPSPWRRRGLLAGILAVVLGLAAAVVVSVRSGDDGASGAPGAARAAVPDVSVALDGGKHRSLASFRGRSLVIGFVQPYCASCISTLRTLDAVARAHPDGSVVPIALNVGLGGVGGLRTFALGVGAPRPLFAADPGLRVADAFGVRELETFVVVDARGRVVTRGVGLSRQTVLDAVARA